MNVHTESKRGIELSMDETMPSLRHMIYQKGEMPSTATLEEVYDYFKRSPYDYVALLAGRMISGMVSRENISFLMGSRFGFSVYGRRSACEYGVREPLILREDMNFLQMLECVMTRSDSHFMQDVMVEDVRGQYLGMINMASIIRAQTRLIQNQVRELERTNSRLQVSLHQLMQAEKLSTMGRMAAGIAHEINNRLTPIVGFSDMLLMRNPADESTGRYLKIINGAASDAGRILRRLLRFSKPVRMEIEELSVFSLIEEALLMLDYSLKVNGIHVNRPSKKTKDHVIRADRVKMCQVFLNLIKNAMEAMGRSHEKILNIDIVERVDQIWVTFTDTGPGLSEEVMDYMQNPNSSTFPENHGSGMGLNISMAIILEHKGCVWGANHPMGGAQITVQLPSIDFIQTSVNMELVNEDVLENC